jgi:hypothetical protein
MSHFTSSKLADLAGISRRHAQRLLEEGKIEGASRTKGGHWRIPDTPKIRKWAENFSRWEGKPRADNYAGVPLISWRDATEERGVVPGDVAEEISKSCEALRAAAAVAAEEMDASYKAALRAGHLLLSVLSTKGAHFNKWVKSNLPGLTLTDADWLLSLARRHKDSAHKVGAVEVMKRITALKRRNRGKTSKQLRVKNPYVWTEHAGKLRTTLTAETISKMDAGDRETARKQLEPLIAIYEKLR